MELGEPTAIPPPSPPPPRLPVLEAKIVKLTFDSSVEVSLKQATISRPHWELGTDLLDSPWEHAARLKVEVGPFSLRPAAFVAGTPCRLKADVQVTKSENVSGPGKLVGTFGSWQAVGSCPTSVGTHTVDLTLAEPPTALAWFHGEAPWTLEVPSAPLMTSLGTTLVEVYFLLGPPRKGYTPSVFVEALRFLFDRLEAAKEGDAQSLARRVTSHCFADSGLKYRGMSHFAASPDGQKFRMGSYLLGNQLFCNCHDQSAAVQALCGAVGVTVQWKYLDKFGFIKPTFLVGYPRKKCNNPNFEGNTAEMLLAWDDPRRKPFENHAFIGGPDGNILDGCAGPYLGDDSPDGYLAAAVDATPTLYPVGAPPPPASAILDTGGLTQVTWFRPGSNK